MRAPSLYDVAVPDRHGPRQLWVFGVWVLIATTFFPYFGFALGNNTNIPISSLVSLFFIPALSRRPRMLLVGVGLLFAPLLAQAGGMVLRGNSVNWNALAVWPAHVLPLLAFAAVALRDPSSIAKPLRVLLGATCAYALVQKYIFLDRGTIPLLGYYDLPGYASVANNAASIITYIRRPFAFFPEPSFLAGTLALAVICLVLAVSRERHRPAWIDQFLVLAVCLVIYVSQSGSGIATIALVLFILYWPMLRGSGRWVGALALLAMGLALGSQVLSTRSTSFNYSWADRGASLLAAARFIGVDRSAFLFGTGAGTSSSLFASGEVSLAGLNYYSRIPDLFSVLARIVFENGIFIGTTVVAFLVITVGAGAARKRGRLVGAASALAYVVVAGLTISYDSAAWLWALPGFCLGCVVSVPESTTEMADR